MLYTEINSDLLIEYAKTEVGKYGNPYAFAFGYVWGTLTDKQKKQIMKDLRLEDKEDDIF